MSVSKSDNTASKDKINKLFEKIVNIEKTQIAMQGSLVNLIETMKTHVSDANAKYKEVDERIKRVEVMSTAWEKSLDSSETASKELRKLESEHIELKTKMKSFFFILSGGVVFIPMILQALWNM